MPAILDLFSMKRKKKFFASLVRMRQIDETDKQTGEERMEERKSSTRNEFKLLRWNKFELRWIFLFLLFWIYFPNASTKKKIRLKKGLSIAHEISKATLIASDLIILWKMSFVEQKKIASYKKTHILSDIHSFCRHIYLEVVEYSTRIYYTLFLIVSVSTSRFFLYLYAFCSHTQYNQHRTS